MKYDPEIIFFYSIGRSGTAYLYQVFGQKKWKPREEAYPAKDTVVVHEKWAMNRKDVEKLKIVKPTSEEGLEIQEKKIRRIRSRAKSIGCNRIIITDSCFSRWCSYYLVQNCNYKAVFLGRKKEDIVKSWENRYDESVKLYGKEKTIQTFQDHFKYNFFNITDKYTLLHVDKKTWRKYSLGQKIAWLYDESRAKWNELKGSMNKKNYLETSYEDIITVDGLTELSKFINLPFSYELMNVRVNYSPYL